MEITRQDSDQQVSLLKIVIEKQDYEQKFTEELKKQRGKSQLKGFRKGKTPMSFLKKVYGQQVLANVVMDKVNESLSDFIKEQELDILGQPLPNEDQMLYSFNPHSLEDMTFLYDVAISPEFEIVGLEDEHERYTIEIDDEIVDKEIETARRRFGKQEEVEEDIEEKDILTISAWEMEGNDKKEDGWETGFTVMVESIKDEKVKEKVLGGKKGDEFAFDIYTIEGEKEDEYVKKYLLNLDEDEDKDKEIGHKFWGKIDKVQRLIPAEMNEDFYQQYLGNEEVKTEEELKEKVREEIAGYYKEQATLVMNRKVMESLMEKTSMEIPDEFLKRWITEINEEVTPEKIESEYAEFKENLRWTLIKNKLAKKYNLKVEQEEVVSMAREKVLGYMRGYPMDEKTINEMIMRFLSNQEQVNHIYEEIMANKVFDKLEGDLNLVEKPISLEDFKDEVKKMNESLSK